MSLEDRLQDPNGWDEDMSFADSTTPFFTVFGDSDSVRLPALRHRQPFLRHDIVMALQLGAEPLDVCPAMPGIFDYAPRGFAACAVLVATQALQDWPTADPTDCVYFIDQRPLLLGLIWGIARRGLVDVAAIRERLQLHCPPGYDLSIRGGRREEARLDGLRHVNAGEVLTAELFLTGFLPPEILFPDARPGLPPQDPDEEDAERHLRDAAELPHSLDTPGDGQYIGRAESSLGRVTPDLPPSSQVLAPIALPAIGLLCLGVGCLAGAACVCVTGILTFPPVWQSGLSCRCLDRADIARVATPIALLCLGQRHLRMIGLLALMVALPGCGAMPLRPLPVSRGSGPITREPLCAFPDPTSRQPVTSVPFVRRMHGTRMPGGWAHMEPCRGHAPGHATTTHLPTGPTLLEEAAWQPNCKAFWEASTLLDTLLETSSGLSAPSRLNKEQRRSLRLSELLPAARPSLLPVEWRTADILAQSVPVSSEPIRFGGLQLPFAVRDLLDLMQPPAKLTPLEAAVPYLTPNEEKRLSALRPSALDFTETNLHCFTDGSFKASVAASVDHYSPLVGWACVFIEPSSLRTYLCSGGWPSWLSSTTERPSAFVAECLALIAASLLCCTIFQDVPVTICVDCTAALGIAAGEIAGHGQGVAGILRRISYLCRAVAVHPPVYRHVAGHKGCFANEVADAFAKLAANGCALGAWSWGDPVAFPWWTDSGTSLDWAGLVIQCRLGDPSLPPPDVPDLKLPDESGGLTPLQCIEPFLRKRETSVSSPSVVGRMTLTILTYNVLSLCGKAFSDAPEDGLALAPARPSILSECLQSAGVDVAAIQEARTAEGTLRTEPYLRFCSGALKGQFGVELWFRTQHKFTVCDAEPARALTFERADFLVLHTDPRRLFVLFSKAEMTLLFVSAHAPHKGAEPHLIDSWWAETRRLLDKYAKRAPTLLLGDFNAAVGSVCSAAVGVLNQDQQDLAGDHLHDLALEHSLWLPSTFEGVHEGPGGTYVQKRNGQESRLDYVCLPDAWSRSQISSWVDSTIHAGQPIIDHIAALVSVELLIPFKQPSLAGAALAFDTHALLTEAGKAELQRILSHAPRVDWAVGPDAHAAIVVDYLQRSLRASFPKPKIVRRHAYLTDETWALHQQVKCLRRRSAKLRAAIAFHSKAACFHAWCRSLRDSVDQGADNAWFVQAREAADHLAQQLQDAAKRLRAGCKADRAAYLESLADKVQKGDADAPHALKRLLCVRKRKPFAPAVLPQLANPAGEMCTSPAEVMACWRTHFSRIEGGRVMSHEAIANLQLEQNGVTASIPFDDFPAPSDLLAALLHARKGKASGPDGLPAELGHAAPAQMQRLLLPLLMKVGLFCAEPLGFKSGILTWLFKGKGSRTECGSYRAIMLLSNLAKTLHRAFRPAIYRFFSDTSLPVQLGGKKQTTVLFGSHLSRSYGRWCAQRGTSTIILFADVAAAYYSAVRSLTARKTLAPAEDSQVPEAVQAQLSRPSALAAGGASTWLEHLTSDFNQRTWMTLAGDTEAILTTKGSRPGSSWADLFFGVTMPGIVSLRDTLREQCGRSCRPISVSWDGDRSFFPTTTADAFSREAMLDDVVWADDMASFLQILRPDDIAQVLGLEASTLVEAFAGFGYSLSFGEYKTAAIVAVRGPGARAARRTLFSGNARLAVLREDQGAEYLPLVPAYKHLGVKVTADNSLLPEIRHRIASAWTAFRQGRTKLFRSKRLGLAAKGHLLSSHVVSRLSFGCGAWGLLRVGEYRAFAGALLSMYRQCLCVPHGDPQDLSCATICALLQQHDPQTLLRLHRLRYARQLVATGPDILWALLKADSAFIEGMQEAFRWMHNWLANTTALPCPSNNWGEWATVLQFRPAYFKGLVKRAGALEGIRVSCYAALQALRKALCLTAECRDPLERAEPDRPVQYHEACLLCKVAFPTRATWAVHAARKHGYRAPATLLANEPSKPLCLGCGKLYANKGRLRRHLLNSSTCRVSWGSFQVFGTIPEGTHAQLPPLQLPGSCRETTPRADPVYTHPGLVDALLGLEDPETEAIWNTVIDFVEPLAVLKQSLISWASHPDAPAHAQTLVDEVALLLDPELWCDDFRVSKSGASTPLACADLVAPDLRRIACATDGTPARFVLPPPPVPEFVYPFRHSLPLRAAKQQCAWLEQACDTVGAFIQASTLSPVFLETPGPAWTCLAPVSTWILECGFVRSPTGVGSAP